MPFSAFAGQADTSPAACSACVRRPPPYLHARSAALYEGTVREALHALKFLGQARLAAPLGDLLVEMRAGAVPSGGDLVVPVPLHRERERQRGFNQSAILARRLARRWRLPCRVHALERSRPTRAQTELTARERRRNVRGAFSVAKPGVIRDRHVVLVDDVFTTGATVAECSRALVRAGARAVSVVTVARVT
jgi:ComF family protein